jgi:acetyltransferase-like isoleucine patch superfamily enzyme
MFSFLNKVWKNKYIYRELMLFPFRVLLYGRCHPTTRIAFDSNLRRRKNLYLSKRVEINSGVVLWPNDEKISIGEYSQLNPYVVVYSGVTIGNNVMIGPHTMLASGYHKFDRIDIPMRFQGHGSKGGIIIKDDVWIGANSVILDGVTVENGCIIGAGSVVTKNCETCGIYAGNPAKKIGIRTNKTHNAIV